MKKYGYYPNFRKSDTVFYANLFQTRSLCKTALSYECVNELFFILRFKDVGVVKSFRVAFLITIFSFKHCAIKKNFIEKNNKVVNRPVN